MFHGLYISFPCYTILGPWVIVGNLVVGLYFAIGFDCLGSRLIVGVALFLQEFFWFTFICLIILLATSCTVGTQGIVFVCCIVLTITLVSKLWSLPKSSNPVGLPSLNLSTLSSSSTASLMHAFNVLCFLGYRAACEVFGLAIPPERVKLVVLG